MNTNNGAPLKGANKKNLIISGAVILVVLVGLFVIPNVGKEKAPETPSEEVATDTATAASETSGALSRADATVKYVGSIIRFSGECTADPVEMKTAAGATIMIDNDTDARRTIMVGSKSYSVGAHRYTLSSMNMGVGEHAVSCDGNAVSKIVIQ